MDMSWCTTFFLEHGVVTSMTLVTLLQAGPIDL